MDPTPALAEIVASLARVRVLCVGDVMLDRFVRGDVERISPEAPIPIVRVRDERAMLGGAGNVVRNIVALGGRCAFMAVIGEDRAGAEIGGLLGDEHKVDSFIGIQPNRRTSVKTRFFAGSQQLLRADDETIAPLDPYDADRLLGDVRSQITTVGALVLSDYGKGVLDGPVAASLIAMGRTQNLPVIVDPKGRDFTRYRGATVLTPNRKELAEATGLPTGTDDEVVTACRQVITQCGVDTVLATRSQDGMTLVGADGSVLHLPAEAREVYDVSGAGDTVVATLAAALAGGAPLAGACRLANLAAGIVVGRVGTAAVPAVDLMTAVHQEEVSARDSKIVGAEDAREVVDKWRRHGLRIGFTNGCFDLLHPGHVSLLRQARAACDRLVVGLNSDASVRRLKGDSRPVQDETARAIVLASLADVDLVAVFGEDTPLGLITTLLPDVLVKGADYTVDTVVGSDVVLTNGGRVLLADLKAGFSTTSTIARLHGGSRRSGDTL
ncbi:bifunctional heptose 7-phosphate kinase/heptose 1-phosphate adenyltransferase [Rhodospirillum rubrum]|uniref:D-glycero-beta-D-manno-heptose-7-phosphate kinase n=1 Tax=Rhodospirillum rubrum TaxID=1085 RepID=UPI00190823E6|nr:D-glycero-beta-D-manno-heptose-7-phosphate kinase [Rhodospirillum rubrum]MBK1664809.1 bifunctional heptose 7-phosphate kinase/heptose 1-phosphate adenyltransferase [Rhodospirillum rubrum]MBK1676713.1 bifunctional heptose 7-phosphate kinase/heptose 1-phosphate adenyltransferase [Rhodospirillum rubrum]